MDHMDLAGYAQQFPKEFERAETFNAFAYSLDASSPGVGRLLQHVAEKYPGAWDASYRTIKRHGFTARALLLPDATKVSDIFESVALYPYGGGGIYRGQAPYVAAGAAFISALYAPGFAYFGRLGASYVRNGKPYISGGKEVLLAAKPSAAVVRAYGACGAGEWDLATFEATRRDNGILVVVRARNGFGERWLCILDADETALAMLPPEDLAKIEAEKARRAIEHEALDRPIVAARAAVAKAEGRG